MELRMPKFMWRLMMMGPKTLYRVGLGRIIGGRVLLLTTIGRVSGLPRATPLQYERIAGAYIIGSARGLDADWVKNTLKEPRVDLQVGGDQIKAIGRVISDPDEVAEFLEQRFANHPFFIKLMFWLQGYRGQLNRATFVQYARKRAIVELTPLEN